MICIQDAGRSLAWYLNTGSTSYTAIDDMEDIVFLCVEHQITFHFSMTCTRQCSRGRYNVPRLAPSSALSACAADASNQVESDIVQTYIA
eukprot:776996-Pyramimonas_sp.AAC.1